MPKLIFDVKFFVDLERYEIPAGLNEHPVHVHSLLRVPGEWEQLSGIFVGQLGMQTGWVCLLSVKLIYNRGGSICSLVTVGCCCRVKANLPSQSELLSRLWC
jgi:hypothetical protein